MEQAADSVSRIEDVSFDAGIGFRGKPAISFRNTPQAVIEKAA